MKKHVKLLLMLLVVAVMALTACVDVDLFPSSSSDSDTPSTESELTLSAFSLSLYPEETATLIATLTEDGEDVIEELKNISKISILACGSAYHVGCVAKYIFEKHSLL